MLVYGDRIRPVSGQAMLDRLRTELADLARLPPGIDRHAALVTSFITAAQLLQAVADRTFDAGCDGWTPPATMLATVVQQLASAVDTSWTSDFRAIAPLPAIPRRLVLPDRLMLRQPEGYAYYALYPEAYAEAARRLVLTGPPRVIGIRSIGTGLAAMVAAALEAPLPLTVRPTGDPFQRRIRLDPRAAADLLSDRSAHFVVVDEGPGLSGSSFGSVADWLEDHGVPTARMAFLPSHAGPPGPMASDRHRQRWEQVQTSAADIGPLLPGLLARWAERRLGPLLSPIEDLSGGQWRRQLYAREEDWPAAIPGQERRKYLVTTAGGQWLLRFAGLGDAGHETLARARHLHARGLTPEPLGLLHGFLVERWHADGRSLPSARPAMVGLSTYLQARAAMAVPASERGVSAGLLLTMARRNTELALGPHWSDQLSGWEGEVARLDAAIQPVAIDGRMDAHKWLGLADGRLLKADATDHCAAHDLVGCQDILWDVAGAATELSLESAAVDALASAVGAADARPDDRLLLAFCRICYPAFRLGQASLALSAMAPDAPEAARLCERIEMLSADLRRAISAGIPPVAEPPGELVRASL